MSHLLSAQLLTSLPLDSPSPSGSTSGKLRLAPVGRCSREPSLTITIIDDSGSVVAPGGSDPIGARYAEIRAALAKVARACRCGKELASVLHFDTPHGDAGPTPLNRRGLSLLTPGLDIPDGAAGSSNLGPALAAARHQADIHREHQVTVVVFSDFALTDPDPAAIAGHLAGFPGRVIAAILGRTDDIEITGADQTIPIGYNDAPGAVGNALIAGLTAHRKGVSSP